jgi:hypothetical protein
MSWSSNLIRAATKPIWRQIYRRSLAMQREPLAHQERCLKRLMKSLASTSFGTDKNLKGITSYRSYLSNLQVTSYSDYQPYVDRIAAGEQGVLCPGPVRALVQTSGTTGYLNKHIPYDDAMLQASFRYQYRVAATLATLCPSVDPIFDERMSYATVVRNTSRFVGTIPKANASELWSVSKVPKLSRNKQVLTTDVLDAPDWETKLHQIESALQGRDIRIVTGIPLYLVGIFDHLVKSRGVESLKDVFPNLSVVFYSGSAIGPYRERLNKLLGRPLRYFGGYLASEGLFGLPAPDGNNLLFNLDDFLFSFRKTEAAGGLNGQALLGIDELEIGQEYEVLVGCPNGFLHYSVGDVIRIETVSPYVTFSVLGRSLSINVANEKTSQAKIDQVTRLLESQMAQPIKHYFVHPRQGQGPDQLPSYMWTLICDEPEQVDLGHVSKTIDRLLIEHAPDYADCRVSDGLIGPVQVQVVSSRAGLQDHLLTLNQGKGQYKMKSVYRTPEEFSQAILPAAQRSGIELVV